MQQDVEHVLIRPESSILTVLSHLNYKPWYAIAEFVDNSIQSYVANREELRRREGAGFKLKIRILFDKDSQTIEISDNAAGIYAKDYKRAFRPAATPDQSTGLSEFGMGMKSAACWFTWTWNVRSKALGETVERSVWFDVKKIADQKIDQLPVSEIPCDEKFHFTVVRLENLGKKFPATRTYIKIRDHLASIYRGFFRAGEVEIYYDQEETPLAYEQPTVLKASPADGSDRDSVEWIKDIKFKMSGGQTVEGFAGVRKEASTTLAGFALFRRGRLIFGSDDETYRPFEIFGRSNDFRYQRIFGELHLTGFEVSHTKDGFNWAGSEEEFIETLRDRLKEPPLDLLMQAHKYRSRQSLNDLRAPVQQEVKEIAEALNTPKAKKVLNERPNTIPLVFDMPSLGIAPQETEDFLPKDFYVDVDNARWLVRLIVDNTPTSNDWIQIRQLGDTAFQNADSGIEITLYAGHPVVANHIGPNLQSLGFMIRLAVALGLSKEKATRSGATFGPFLYWLNRIMREADLNG
jgi:hypothetical protein